MHIFCSLIHHHDKGSWYWFSMLGDLASVTIHDVPQIAYDRRRGSQFNDASRSFHDCLSPSTSSTSATDLDHLARFFGTRFTGLVPDQVQRKRPLDQYQMLTLA